MIVGFLLFFQENKILSAKAASIHTEGAASFYR